MLQYSMAIIAYSQQLLDIEDLFETEVNCTVGIYKLNFIEKKVIQIKVGYELLM